MINKAEYKKCDVMFMVTVLMVIFAIGYTFKANKKLKERYEDNLIIANSGIDDLPTPYCVRDLEGKFISYNKAFQKLVFDAGGVKENMIGKHPSILFGLDARTYDYNDSIIINDKVTKTFVESGLSPTGERITISLIKSPIFRSKEDSTVLAVKTIANYKF